MSISSLSLVVARVGKWSLAATAEEERGEKGSCSETNLASSLMANSVGRGNMSGASETLRKREANAAMFVASEAVVSHSPDVS